MQFERKRILLPKPHTEARLKFKKYEQIQIVLAIIKAQVISPTLSLEPVTPQEKLKNLQNQIRFKNYLDFLEYEILLGFDSIQSLKNHLAKPNPCSKRFDLIAKFSAVDINKMQENSTIRDFINYPQIQDLRNNTSFQNEWKQYEIVDQPKWSSYTTTK
jgi:hypothetical protein